MTTNAYTGNTFRVESEQDLYEDLVIEAIQFKGIDCKYIPRTALGTDDFLNEIHSSEFISAYDLEMYIQADGFGTSPDFMGKFGIEIPDTATFTMSKRRFTEVITAGESDVLNPREGDLILFPVTNTLLEIRFVEDQDPFFQLGKQYVWKTTTEIFNYNHEEFDTGDVDVDAITSALELELDHANVDRADNTTIENESIDDNIIVNDEPNPFS